MNGVRLAVQAAAAYRITRLLQEDTLPPLPMLRRKLNDAVMRELEDGRVGSPVQSLADFAHCPWCLGFWVSAFVVAADTLAPRAWRPLATALALSAAVGLARTKLD